LPNLRIAASSSAQNSQVTSPKSPKSPSLAYFTTHTHRPALGKCAFRAQHQPAPGKVSGEESFMKTDANLRKARALRRTRSCPGGLMELDNAAHIQFIG
jgi:hypothetical protein